MSAISGIGGGAAGVQQIMALRQQIMDRNQVLQQLHAPQGTAQVGQTQAPTNNFAGAFKTALDGVNATQVKAEGISEAYQRGEVTDVAKVMLARQEASVSFEATLQVRNKLLSAYQDIMRMGV